MLANLIKLTTYLAYLFFLINVCFIFSSCKQPSQDALTECHRFKKIIDTIPECHVLPPSVLYQNMPFYLKNAVIDFLTFYHVKTDTPLSENPELLCLQAMDVVFNKAKPQKPSDLTRDLLNFYLRQIDPHSRVLTNESDLRERLYRKSFGFTAGHLTTSQLAGRSSLPNNNAIFEAEDVIAGGPADLAHLYEGMKFRILKIDGKTVQRIPVDPNPFIEQAQTLEIEPLEKDKPLPQIHLVAQDFAMTPLEQNSFSSAEGTIAYIKLRYFSGAETSFNAALQYFQRMAVALILDLRNNPGDYLDETLLIGKQLIFNGRGKAFLGRLTPHHSFPSEDKLEAIDSMWDQDKPIIVLVNDRTKSIAEVLAGALQDYGSLIVGTTTFGKGTELSRCNAPMYQSGLEGTLLLTDAFFIRPSGQMIQEKGVIPDVIFNLSSIHTKREAYYPNALKSPQDQTHLSGYEPSDLLKNKPDGFEFLKGLQHTVDELVLSNATNRSYEELELEAAKQVAIQYVHWKASRSED